MANDGLRVLGVAQVSSSWATLCQVSKHGFAFDFLGFIGLADPVRSKVADAIEECNTVGIHVVIITGDCPATALHSARQIGLQNPDHAITGTEHESLGKRRHPVLAVNALI